MMLRCSDVDYVFNSIDNLPALSFTIIPGINSILNPRARCFIPSPIIFVNENNNILPLATYPTDEVTLSNVEQVLQVQRTISSPADKDNLILPFRCENNESTSYDCDPEPCSILKDVRIKHYNRVIFAHINIMISYLVTGNIDILLSYTEY